MAIHANRNVEICQSKCHYLIVQVDKLPPGAFLLSHPVLGLVLVSVVQDGAFSSRNSRSVLFYGFGD